MYSNVSSTFIFNINQPSRTFSAEIRDGQTALNTVMRSLKYTNGTNSQNYITLGSAICASVEIKMTNPGVTMLGKEYGIYIGLNTGNSVEYIPFGLFTAEKPVLDENGEVTVKLYDRMKKFETAYFTHLTYPAPLTDVLQEVCQTADVPYIAPSTNITIEKKPEGYTCREMIVYLGQLLGKFAIIDRSGNLVFKWYSEINYSLNAGRYFSPFEKSEKDYTFTKITAVIGKETNESGSVDKKVSAGTGLKGIVFENPFYTQNIIDSVYSSLNGLTFRPASVKALGDPRIDPGDVIKVTGLLGEKYKIPVMNLVFSFDGGLSMDISAVGEEEQKNDFSVKGPATQAIDRMSTRLLLAEQALVTKLTADEAEIRYAKITELNAVNASITQMHTDFIAADNAIIERFSATEATVNNLTAANGRIAILESDYADIRTLLAGTTAVEEAQMINLTANNAKINEVFLKSLIAASITANDLKAGTIYTNKHTIMSEDGAMVMDGSVLTFKDANGTVRIQIGKDGQGNYNYYLVNADGDIIWDATGITKDGIPDGLIVDDMVADSTDTYHGISASKLNIHSMIGAINEEGGLKSSSIVMDEDGQSLTVAFANMREGIDSLTKGGNNLIVGTLNPDVSEVAKYPKIIGQTVPTVINGTAAVAEHGIKSIGSAGATPGFEFGSDSTASASMNGLKAGETYTLSFDASWKLFSEYTGTDKQELDMVFGYMPTQGSSFIYKTIPISEVTSGTDESCSFSGTFTVPTQCVAVYIGIAGDNDYMQINDHILLYPPYSPGDTIEINGTQIQVDSFSDTDCIEINGNPIPKQGGLCADGDYIELKNLKLERGSIATAWSPASEDYLEFTQNKYSELSVTIDGIMGRVGTLETTTTEHGQTLTSHTTTITQTANKINRIITDSQIAELDTGTSMFDKLVSVEETADGVKTDVTSLKSWKDTATGQISSMESTQNTFRQDLNGTENRLTTLQTTLQNDYSTTAQTESLISTSRGEILQSVSSTYVNKTDAVNSVVIEYAKGTSQTTAPTSGWSTASPTWESGKYIWQRTAITKNGSTTYSNVSCIQGAKGETGANGSDGRDGISVSILSTEIKYQAHTSGTSVPTGTWQDTVPTVAQGRYLWTRTKVNYSDGTSTTSYSVGRMGNNGTNGQNGTSPTVTSTVTKYQQSTNGTTTPTGTWQTTPPTATAGQYMWTQTTVTYSDGATAVSYSVSKNGTKGDTGVGIREVIPRYCLWTSDTNPPADTYSDPTYGWFENKKPDWAEGRYIWMQTKIVYDDDTVANPHVEYTTAICDTTLNSLESRVYKAELKITDESIISTVSASYGIADANLIYNSTGFGGSTDGWALSRTSANYELFADYESTRPGKTDYALGYRIKTTSTTTVYMRQTAEHNIPVVQGIQYTLSGFYYRGSNVKTGCQIGIEYGNNGSGWTSTNSADYNVRMTATGAWTAFSLTFTAPKNTVRVAVKAAGSSSTTANNVIYVCDLVLVRGTETMPWAEQPVSLIQQSADMIRLQAEKLVWVANNSSLTEAGYLTVTGGQIGGFAIDSTSIRNLASTSTANGSVLLSTADVSRTIAGTARTDVRFAIGANMGVTNDGTLYASNGHFSGEITSTTGTIGGIKIYSNGIASDNTYIEDGALFHDYLKITKTGEIKIYSTTESLEEENPVNADVKFHLNRKGKLWVSELGNDYWNISGKRITGRYASGCAYTVALTASDSELDSGSGWAMAVSTSAGESTYILRHNGSVQCTALTISALTSGTGSAVVANSSGRLYITSSSKRYKDYIADMAESEAEKLYDLPVVQFKYKEGYLDREDEAYDKPLHGFFAEDVADMFSDGGIHNAAGDVENYSERAIIARLVKLVQMQHREIESLKASMQS